ncbi:hypothetical protein JHK87_040221 [Glycine soja]|nr:hypothetical protein JHK87_040221 [Glycine soja]
MGKGALWFNVFLKEGSVRVGKGNDHNPLDEVRQIVNTYSKEQWCASAIVDVYKGVLHHLFQRTMVSSSRISRVTSMNYWAVELDFVPCKVLACQKRETAAPLGVTLTSKPLAQKNLSLRLAARPLGAVVPVMCSTLMSIAAEGILGTPLFENPCFIPRSLKRRAQLLIAMLMMIQSVFSLVQGQIMS